MGLLLVVIAVGIYLDRKNGRRYHRQGSNRAERESGMRPTCPAFSCPIFLHFKKKKRQQYETLESEQSANPDSRRGRRQLRQSFLPDALIAKKRGDRDCWLPVRGPKVSLALAVPQPASTKRSPPPIFSCQTKRPVEPASLKTAIERSAASAVPALAVGGRGTAIVGRRYSLSSRSS